jgi:FixJ family two-component response regulator
MTEADPIVFVVDDDPSIRDALASLIRSVGLRAGTFRFARKVLTKPFRDQDLLDAIAQAIARDHVVQQQRADLATWRQRYDALTHRERDVMRLVVSGWPNKQIADGLGSGEVTSKLHRGQIMRKIRAESSADPVSVAARLGIPVTRY